MTNLLILDFETVDKYLSKEINLGEGWTYAIHNKNEQLFKVLGWGLSYIAMSKDANIYCFNNEDSLAMLKQKLLDCDGIVGHNLQYELGCLKYLGIDIRNKKIYDTMIIAKLYDNTLFNYSLEALSEKYLLAEYHKDKNILINGAIDHQLCEHLKPKTAKASIERYLANVGKWCYSNMDILQSRCPEVMAKYCIQDLISTRELFKFLVKVEPV